MLSITFLTFFRYDVAEKATRHSDHGDDHTHKPATEEDIKMSMEEITAQLIQDPLMAMGKTFYYLIWP